MAWWFEIKLWKRVFLGLALGVVFGLGVTNFLGAEQGGALLTEIKIIGDIFIGLIRLVIVPLIFMTLVAGVLALGDPAKLGTIGLKTIVLYLITTFFANIIGLGMGTIFQPGRGVDLGDAVPREVTAEAAGFWDRVSGMLTKNPFEQFLSGSVMTMALTAVLLVIAIIVARRSTAAGEKKPKSGILFVGLFALGVAAASGEILACDSGLSRLLLAHGNCLWRDREIIPPPALYQFLPRYS